MDNHQRQTERFWELSLDIMCLVDFHNRFQDVNSAFERILGYSKDEVLGKSIADFMHPDDLTVSLVEAKLHLDGHIAHEFQNRYRCKDGSYKWMSWNFVTVADERLIYAFARDVTESKKEEEILRESEKRFRTMFESIDEGFCIIE